MVTILRTTQISSDPRTCAIIAALEEVASNVTVVCWPRLANQEIPPDSKFTSYIPFSKVHSYGKGIRGLSKYIGWWIWAIKKIRELNPTNLVAIDLDSGIITLFMKKFYRVEYFYDQTDPMSARFSNRFLVNICDRLEKIIVSNARAVTYPSKSRDRGWNASSRIVENQFLSDEHVRKLSELDEDPNSLFYGGLLIPGRGIDELVSIPEEELYGFKIRVAGYGPLANRVMDAAKNTKNIFYYGELSHDDLLRMVAKSRVVLAFYDPKVSNNVNLASGKINEARALNKIVISNHGIGLTDKNIQLVNYEKINVELPIILKNLRDFRDPARTKISKSSLDEFKKFYNKEFT